MLRSYKTTLLLLCCCLLLASQVCAAQALPRLVDVGSDKCIPCIKMAPILDALKEDFAGQMEVVFIDAWKNREEAQKHRAQMIPTQIFYDAQGKELYRHVG
ncbi:MAG: thioredoxin family protein, partial [Desulfuromonadales bacterium]|nr:thioredoxin family protein [Desulfuromonadales bacterium]